MPLIVPDTASQHALETHLIVQQAIPVLELRLTQLKLESIIRIPTVQGTNCVVLKGLRL